MTVLPAAHSPLGASGAYQWLVCPGSVTMSEGWDDPDSEYSALGTSAHELASICLNNGEEPWIYINDDIGSSHKVDKNMADAVSEYIRDVVMDGYSPGSNQVISRVEHRFHCPSIHEYFYGTADYWQYDAETRTLTVRDYKHGEGIVVEAEDNPQLKYYAIGVLESESLWDAVDLVKVAISQPRAFHPDGSNRMHTYTVKELAYWLGETLLPGMERALVSRDTKAGTHCRFCPARFGACDALMNTIDELEALMAAPELTAEQLGRRLALVEIAKIMNKADRETALARLMKDREVPGWKLVNGKSNRIWKEGAERAMSEKFGSQAKKPTAFLSPAQIEKLPEGKDFTARWGFKPPPPKSIAPENDRRREISSNTKSMFKPVAKKGT